MTQKLTIEAVRSFLSLTHGTIRLKDIQEGMGIGTEEGKVYLRVIMSRLAENDFVKRLGKHDGNYRITELPKKPIEWWKVENVQTLKLGFPLDPDTQSGFGFADNIVTYPKDLHVVTGVSNQGKTAYCLNFILENMDNYPCRYITSEFNAVKFKDRMARYNWANILDENGEPKFETIPLEDEYYEDQIDPDKINVIDWINLPGDFWQIGTIMRSIQSKLNNGMCLISLQKSEEKTLGRGGDFSRDLASFYLAIDPIAKGVSARKLTVVKAKVCSQRYLEGVMFLFDIIQGAKFDKIREVKICPTCKGTGYVRGAECSCYHGYIGG